MTDRPILFSDAMARAILAGTKTQTRRVMTPQPIDGCGAPIVGAYHPIVVRRGIEEPGPERWGASTDDESWPCPYGRPGGRLWVREAWRVRDWPLRTIELRDGPQPGHRFSREDDAWWERWGRRSDGGRWQPSIYMPRWASRLTLEVTSVRVERVQAISEEDARAEGVERAGGFMSTSSCWTNYGPDGPSFTTASASFMSLWDSINGERPGCSWEANPWVWVVAFRRVGQ